MVRDCLSVARKGILRASGDSGYEEGLYIARLMQIQPYVGV
jgi:hypothetical protein